MAHPTRSGDAGLPHEDDQNLDVLAALDPANPAYKLGAEEWDARQRAEMLRTGRIPTLADYRKVYDNMEQRHGYPRPTDEEIRARHLVVP